MMMIYIIHIWIHTINNQDQMTVNGELHSGVIRHGELGKPEGRLSSRMWNTVWTIEKYGKQMEIWAEYRQTIQNRKLINMIYF